MRRIEMLEEGQAHGQIKEIYKEIQHYFGTSFVGSIFRALATQPGLLETVWQQIRPNVETQAFVDLSNRIRQRTDSLAQLTIELDDLYFWLQDHRFSREEIRHILYTLEALHYVNPKLMLVTAALTVSAAGIRTPNVTRRKATQITSEEPEYPDKLPQIMFEQAPSDVKEDYYDIAAVMGAPIIPDDFQSLAACPPFLRRVWNMLKPVMRSTTLLDEAQNVSAFAIEAAQELPYPVDLHDIGPDTRRIIETLLSVSSRTMIGISAVRWMLIEGQQNARIAGRAAGERSAE